MQNPTEIPQHDPAHDYTRSPQAPTAHQAMTAALSQGEAAAKARNRHLLTWLAGRLHLHDTAYILIYGTDAEILGWRDPGYSYEALQQMAEEGRWAAGRFHFYEAGPGDEKLERGICECLSDLSVNERQPYAIIWRSMSESYPHLAFGGYTLTQAMRALGTAIAGLIAEEVRRMDLRHLSTVEASGR